MKRSGRCSSPLAYTGKMPNRRSGVLAGAGADLGELFLQNRVSEGWALEGWAIVKEGSFSLDRGLGVRALSGEKTGAAYAEDIRPEGLANAVEAARSITRAGGPTAGQRPLRPLRAPTIYGGGNPITAPWRAGQGGAP